LRIDAEKIINHSISEVLPEKSVKSELSKLNLKKNPLVIAVGKAAWRMAAACSEYYNGALSGYVITKYGHSMGIIPGFEIYEAGHPVPDENTIKATDEVLMATSELSKDDIVLFLVSGGGSALFESLVPGINLEDMRIITNELLKSGASIREINTIRKKLSRVKGGGFLKWLAPAEVITLSLSDVLGDDPKVIASGPTVKDEIGSEYAMSILEKYEIEVGENIENALNEGKKAEKCIKSDYLIIGSLDKVCKAAEEKCNELGYNTYILTTSLECEAREAGNMLASIAKSTVEGKNSFKLPCAFICGGETVVKIKGNGKGGRNQELALSAAIALDGLDNVIVASIGTDGTDGPTDAAGGIVSGKTAERLRKKGLNASEFLDNNDSYHALSKSGDIFKTGPTGTNVNDLILILCGKI